MKKQNISLRLFVITLFIFFCTEIITGQEANEKSSFSINSVGISLGWYNPSLDYWQENSEFKDASFSGAIDVKGFLDLQIIKNLHGQIGIGYWQSSVEHDLQGFGSTKLLLTGVPISLDVIYNIEPIRFSILTPYVGVGGEYTFIQHKLNFEQKDNPDPSSGSTFIGSGIVGLDAKLSESFAIALEFRYKFGSYFQEFKTEIIDPENPEEPTYEIVKEEISLSGPRIGISLKYLF